MKKIKPLAKRGPLAWLRRLRWRRIQGIDEVLKYRDDAAYDVLKQGIAPRAAHKEVRDFHWGLEELVVTPLDGDAEGLVDHIKRRCAREMLDALVNEGAISFDMACTPDLSPGQRVVYCAAHIQVVMPEEKEEAQPNE